MQEAQSVGQALVSLCPQCRQKYIGRKLLGQKRPQLYQEYDYHLIWEWWKAYWNAHGTDFRKIVGIHITPDGYESATAHFLCSIKGVLDIKIPITVLPRQIYGSHWPLMLLSYTLDAWLTLHFSQVYVKTEKFPHRLTHLIWSLVSFPWPCMHEVWTAIFFVAAPEPPAAAHEKLKWMECVEYWWCAFAFDHNQKANEISRLAWYC